MIRAPKGTKDIIGEESSQWQWIEQILRNLGKDFGYQEIRTPMFEQTELFARGVGETTDIVQKEMYTFEDKKNRSMTLKPEGTAGAVRAYLENKLYADTQPTKLYYLTPAFRYEKPQAGRFRQFHQFGVELFGSAHPMADAEVISLGYQMLERCGLRNIEVHINSLGDRESRAEYHQVLSAFLEEHQQSLCPTCQQRMIRNPLRVLDCKEDSCQTIVRQAPKLLDYLNEADRQHFEAVLDLLNQLAIPYKINPWIVRGLDYYSRTVFEFISQDIGAQSTICGGGRYDHLIEEMGGNSTPAIGFAAGIERLLMVLGNTGCLPVVANQPRLYIGYRGDRAMQQALRLTHQLRQAHVRVVTDLFAKSVKAQMKYANRIQADYAIIIGDDELQQGQVSLKEMTTGETQELTFDQLVAFFTS